MKAILFVALAALIAVSWATTWLDEDFSKDGWESRWVVSNWKQSDGTAGKWDLEAGTYAKDRQAERGLHTSQDARFYAISTKLSKGFSNKDKRLVLQFSVKHQQTLDCGGGYIKLLDWVDFNGESPYSIMFGPDICGPGHKIVHFILNRKGENKLIKKNVAAESDEFTHTYTAVLNKDNTYAIYVDGEKKQDGNIEDDWNVLAPKKINDPSKSKPSDWVDDAQIDDPTDKKPSDWDDVPAEISDEHAKKPDDWDSDLDGEWEAPKVPNPEYKGPWRAKRISNPAYKGPWVHPQIDNPDYHPDPHLHAFDSHGVLGIEIWQVKSGSIFDNFLVTDDLDAALAKAKTINGRRDHEKELKKAADDKASADAEEAAKKAESAEKEDL